MKYRIKSDLRKGGIVFDVSQVLEEVHDEVPPGIVCMWNPNNGKLWDNFSDIPGSGYWKIIPEAFEKGYVPYKIRVGDEVWTVNDVAKNKVYDRVVVLKSFEWRACKWVVYYENEYGKGCVNVGDIEKIPAKVEYDGANRDEYLLYLKQKQLESRVKAIEDFLSNFKK